MTIRTSRWGRGCALVLAAIIAPPLGGCALERGGAGADLDAGGALDAGRLRDAAEPSIDAQVADAFAEVDAFVEADAFVEVDAFVEADAFVDPDAGPCDPIPAGDVLHATRGSITIDGDLSDWSAARFVAIDGWDGSGARPGAADLGATLAAMWSPDALYVAVDVLDDDHRNSTSAPELLWQGDSVQIGFDVAASARAPGYDSVDDFEYGWARVSSALRRHRWVAPIGAAAPSDVASVVRVGERTHYEVRLSASDLGLGSLTPGMRVRMGLIVNEDDGAGREGWLEWGSGIGAGKDPRLFRDLVLGERLCATP